MMRISKRASLLLVGSALHLGATSVTQAATDCNAVTEISPAECESLLELYHSTDGANWKNNEGWNVTNTPCSWKGITCENYGVTEIYLSYNQLTGTIPNFSLPKLENLELDSNQLTGTIPNFSLPKLENLDLDSNQLTGTIPNFSALPKLEALDLDSNQLTGTIPNFSLPKLLVLQLHSNQLTGTIPNFSLPNLEMLWLHSNQLTGTIPNFSALPKLLILQLNSNQLTGMIPVSYNTLINLIYFDIRKNPLCKKADFDYSIWPIRQSRFDDKTTWQAQLETFPICEVPTDDDEPDLKNSSKEEKS
jgi:Leucine-rich repeat (LRR) protein